ncbi:MAG: SDR family NAD(P)-dependent oxidoreductase [Candidatus Bathyarchaeia archaeon]
MTNKRVLITGGAGFIGSHLAEALVEKGYLVKVLDDFSGGNVNNIRKLFNYRNFKLIKGDVRDKELIRKVTTDVDYIFHLAAQISVDRSIIDPEYTLQVNVLGTLNILNAALENDVELVVYASSSEAYGTAQYVPMDEKHPLNPASPYAATKAAADRLCFSYYNTYKLPVIIARFFNTYGPKQRDTAYAAVIPKFIRRVIQGLPPIIYGDGKQTRDYMYIKDAVRAYELILKSYENLLGRAINFGSGTEISILKLSEMIVELCGQKGNLKPIHVAPRPGEVKRLYADISLARKLVDFEPQYSLETGLTEFIRWYKEGKYEEWKAYVSEGNIHG